MRIHLVNPSHVAFGTAIITPRWLYVLAAATPPKWGDPILTDETLEMFDPAQVEAGDVVGIGIHTSNALRGYEVGRLARAWGAYVVYGGIHATLYPDEAHDLGGAHAVVKGDGDAMWAMVLDDCANGGAQRIYEGGRLEATELRPARWDLMPQDRYMMASVQTVRGCPKHCSFCSVWRTDGQKPRQHTADVVVQEVVELRRRGFRFIALADDNFYPVTLEDLAVAARRKDPQRLRELEAIRAERFELMTELARLPADLNFYTQITMEAAEDPEFLKAMRQARIRGALVGIESVTPEGLKEIYKDFNVAGDQLVERLRQFRRSGVQVLGSFIFGLPSDQRDTFAATVAVANRAEVAFAQFVMLTPLPGTIRLQSLGGGDGGGGSDSKRYPTDAILAHSTLEQAQGLYSPLGDVRRRCATRTQHAWDHFYSLTSIWRRSRIVGTVRDRVAFILISKLYRQMYANTGIATDSARVSIAAGWARWLAKPLQRLFSARPMPDLQVPTPL